MKIFSLKKYILISNLYKNNIYDKCMNESVLNEFLNNDYRKYKICHS